MDSPHKVLVMRIAGGFTSQRVTNGEFVSMWWRHNVLYVPGVFSTRCGVPAGCRPHGGSGIGTVIKGGTIIGGRKWLEWNWEILQKMAMSSLLKSYETTLRSNQVTVSHMSRQLRCRGKCKIINWLDHYFTVIATVSRYKIRMMSSWTVHEDVIPWKKIPRYSPRKGQWRGALKISLICASVNAWVNNLEPGDLRRHPAYYDISVMLPQGSQ